MRETVPSASAATAELESSITLLNGWITVGEEGVKIWLLWGCQCPSLPFARTVCLFP